MGNFDKVLEKPVSQRSPFPTLVNNRSPIWQFDRLRLFSQNITLLYHQNVFLGTNGQLNKRRFDGKIALKARKSFIYLFDGPYRRDDVHCTKIDATTEATLARDWPIEPGSVFLLVEQPPCHVWFLLRPLGGSAEVGPRLLAVTPVIGRLGFKYEQQSSPSGGNLRMRIIKDDNTE